MAWVDALGFCASFAVLASFCMTTIVPLRACALASNVLFCSYGLLAHIYPVMFLHMLLLPINLVKLWRLRFAEAESSSAELVGER
jgi:hypothetical protein